MADKNEKDKKIELVDIRGIERKESSSEVPPEGFNETLIEGDRKAEIIKEEAGEEIDSREETAITHGAGKDQAEKLHSGREKFKKGIEEAEGNLRKEISELQEKPVDMAIAGKCLNCGKEIEDSAKFCAKCGTELATGKRPEEREKEETKKMTLEETEKFFDSLKEKAILVSSSDESLLEKRKKIMVMFSEMAKAVNDKITEDNLFKTQKGKETGSLLVDLKNEIDKNPETRKEIEEKLKANGEKLQKLYISKGPEKEVKENIKMLDDENTGLKSLYNELDREGQEEEIREKNTNESSSEPKKEEKNNINEEGLLTEKEVYGNSEAKKEIDDLLNDPASELFIKTKAIKFREGRIAISEERMGKERQDSVYYKERMADHRKNVEEHQTAITKFNKEISRIKNEIIKKHGGRIIKDPNIIEGKAD